jgi:hypothetical protein
MSTKSLLAQAATNKPASTPVHGETAVAQATKTIRVKKTITLDPQTVKALHKLRAHISIEEEAQTDFGRIIDEAVQLLLKSKGL